MGTITLTNVSPTLIVSFNSFTITGTNASNYSIASNGCTGGLGPGMNCPVVIMIASTSTALETATFTITTGNGGPVPLVKFNAN